MARKGDVVNIRGIMIEYCRDLDRCTLNDLRDFAEDLLGEVQQQLLLEVATVALIRIDRENYIADKYVSFDMEAIDEILNSLLVGDYMPLKSFTSFVAYPYCGQTWNLFLLESYCRRFSKKFRFDASTVNSSNVGVVVRRSCTLNYTEIMADAVANSDIVLENRFVVNFLYSSGYIAKGANSKIGEIIATARNLRERI